MNRRGFLAATAGTAALAMPRIARRCCMDPPSGVRNRRGVGGCALT